MLGSGKGLHIGCVLWPLQAVDDSHAHCLCEPWILAVCLLAASPARVAEYVDIGGPEGQPLIAPDVAAAAETVELGTRLVAHHRERLAHRPVVERGGHTYGLGKHCGISCARNPVQGLAPPVELRDAEARNGRRGIHHKRYLLIKCEASQHLLGLGAVRIGSRTKSRCRHGGSKDKSGEFLHGLRFSVI